MIDMEHYADLLLPMVQTLEMEILTPVYPTVYSGLCVIEDNLVLTIETSSNPLLISGYTVLFKSELNGDEWRPKIKDRIKEKMNLVAQWKNGETVQ